MPSSRFCSLIACAGQTLPSASSGQALSVAFDRDFDCFDFDSDREGHDVQSCRFRLHPEEAEPLVIESDSLQRACPEPAGGTYATASDIDLMPLSTDEIPKRAASPVRNLLSLTRDLTHLLPHRSRLESLPLDSAWSPTASPSGRQTARNRFAGAL
jgi:hypothetical protein